MALLTLGSSLTTSLSALAFLRGINGMSAVDVGTLSNLIVDDRSPSGHLRIPGAFRSSGLLEIPRRGTLQVLPGDYVGVDARGWPILLSADTIALGPWTHS